MTNIPDKKLPRILIVDDEELIRNLLLSVLGESYECELAVSAEAALGRLGEATFDLVISDINMGGMDGIELARRISATSPETVVMMVSGNEEIDSPIEALRNGAFDYLRKPFNVDQVQVAVERAIRHGSLLVSKRRHEAELETLVAERAERLNYLAYHDPLTGLANRSFFEEKLNDLVANNALGAAVISLSIDRFQGIRDTLGHTQGDRVLVEFAKRLARLNAELIARFEGAEFSVLVHGRDAAAVVDEVFQQVKNPISAGEYEIYITVSVGIDSTQANGDSETLLRNAGAALTRARSLGGNNFQSYTPEMHREDMRRLTLENSLRRALEKHEFELYYQPKVDVNSRQIVGMEALVRWNHPEFGMVPPADFIAIAEENGFIIPLGEWIVAEACRQSKEWHDKGHKLKVAVNLSACQLQQGDLVARVARIIADSGLAPEFLNLEVTESSIMHDPDAASRTLHELRQQGIHISVDDFGTGHSSLGYLKKLPIDVLKIDRSFVSDVTTDRDDAALVMAIIDLAHTLRLKVVAEGVESEDQLAFLHLLRCDEWQGYLFSEPIRAAEFERLLAEDLVFRLSDGHQRSRS